MPWTDNVYFEKFLNKKNDRPIKQNESVLSKSCPRINWTLSNAKTYFYLRRISLVGCSDKQVIFLSFPMRHAKFSTIKIEKYQAHKIWGYLIHITFNAKCTFHIQTTFACVLVHVFYRHVLAFSIRLQIFNANLTIELPKNISKYCLLFMC